MKRDLNLSVINPIFNHNNQRYEGSGDITLTSANVDKRPVTGKQLVLQRIVVAIMMTPGTIIERDSVNWGGNVKKITGSVSRLKDIDTKIELSELVDRVYNSITEDQEDFEEHTVESINIINIDKLSRGFSVRLSVKFIDGTIEEVGVGLPNLDDRKRQL